MSSTKIFGTSHVAGESIELIQREIERHQPDIVGIELDPGRLQALLNDQDGETDSMFLELVRRFQMRIGEKTGVMPGEEMVYAYEKAADTDADIALIDQDISVTFQRLKEVSRREKVKAAASLLFGGLFGISMDLDRIPNSGEIENLLEETEKEFPGIHSVLIRERNSYMAAAIRQLELKNPEAKILVFVGAGHKSGIERLLDEGSSQNSLEFFGDTEA